MGKMFCQAEPGLFLRGPFPIPAKRRIANQFHRLFSIKAGMRTLCVESPLEADAIYWAESDPNITELCEQPLRINKPIGNKPYFTFDLSFKWKSGNEYFYEIKPESSMEKSYSGRLVPKDWQVIEEICKANAYTCRVLSDTEINKKALAIQNWRRFLPFARQAYENDDPQHEDLIINFVKSVDNSTISQVLAQLPQLPHSKTINHIAKLAHQGVLNSDIENVRLTDNTILWINEAYA